MPNYDQRCLTCGHIFTEYRPMARYAANPACEKCGAATEQAHLPASVQVNSDPVVVYQAPDGSYRYPGATDSISTRQYDNLGYKRVELRGWADVRRFEKNVNTREASEIARRVERHLECREIGTKMRRSEILNGMRNGFQIPEQEERTVNGQRVLVRTGRMKTVRMSEAGKAVMENMIERNDNKPRPRSYEPGFHVDAYSNDRSNRDESRRSDGKRFRD